MITIKTHRIKMRAIRLCLGEVYYFDMDGIYRKASLETARRIGVVETENNYDCNSETRMPFRWMDTCVSGCNDAVILGQAARELCIGESINDLAKNIARMQKLLDTKKSERDN